MKKFLFLTACVLLSVLRSVSQTAPNFTATDCNGQSHNLYAELADGKVIVLVWVMPCASCIGPALTAYNVVQSYSNPKIVYWLIDDAANTPCTTLSGWATNNGIGSNRTNFSTSAIVESNYGGVGMPHVAVVAPDRKYYFNALNADAGNATNIQNGINAALTHVGIKSSTPEVVVKATPNPASSVIELTYTLPSAGAVTVEVVNTLGQVITTYALQQQEAGKHVYEVNISSLANGTYFFRFNTPQSTQLIEFTVSH